MTPAERSMRARLAAHTMHARHDSKVVTAPARAAFRRRFEEQARQEARERGESLKEAEIVRRAEHFLQAHMQRLALKSAQARARRQA